MIYNSEFFEELTLKLYEASEGLASELDEEGINNQVLTVSVQNEFFEFQVEATVENYKYEEDTNSVDYKARIFCKEIPDHEEDIVVDYMKAEFLNEILYEG